MSSEEDDMNEDKELEQETDEESEEHVSEEIEEREEENESETLRQSELKLKELAKEKGQKAPTGNARRLERSNPLRTAVRTLASTPARSTFP